MVIPGAVTVGGGKGHLQKSLRFCSQHLVTREEMLMRAAKITRNVLNVLMRYRKVLVCVLERMQGL